MRTINREIVSALIFSKDSKLFQGMKAEGKGGVYSDCWHIPGGGVDEGEDKITALIREIKEETGIDISLYKIELVDNFGKGESEKILKDTEEKVLCKMNFYVYKIAIDDKYASEIKVELNDDLVKYKWFDLIDLKNIKLTPPSVELFKRLGYIK
jgi:8-oxo-dGTP pyrophosphatase MutT (NUDIX family)